MPFVAILIGAVVLIAAFNNSHATLAHELEQDIPGYFKWAVAIAAILGLGFIPGMKVPSRWLIALVAVVVVLNNYQQILSGFTGFAQASPAPTGSGAADPTSAYVQSGGQGGTPSQQQIAGIATPDAGGESGGGTQMAGGAGGGSLFDPGALVSNFTQSIGFGGLG
jgi:hypothetical protein